MRLMMRLLPALLLAPASARAGEPPATREIETLAPDPAAPLSAIDLERFRQGGLPRFRNSIPVQPGVTMTGHGRYRCHASEPDKEKVYWHRSDPRMRLVVFSDSEISLDAVVRFDRCFGMRVLRGPDGRLRQVSTIADVFFFSEERSRIALERYRTLDCETSRDGSMRPREGAEPETRTELWADPGDRTDTSWTFRSRQILPNGKPDRIIVTTFSETPALAEIESWTYDGRDESSDNLTALDSIQRVPWPEGPGYLQIIKAERRKPGQGMVLEANVVESWTVGEDGAKTRVKSEDLLARGEEQAQPSEDF